MSAVRETRGAAIDIYRRLMDAVEPQLVDTAEVGILVDSGLGIIAAYDIANEAHHRLLHDVPKLDDVTVHVSPSNDDGEEHHSLTAHHSRPGPERA